MSLADELYAEAILLGDDVIDLEELTARPAWMRDAACREHPTAMFFPRRGEDTRPAKKVCSACLVRVECRDHALQYPLAELHGIWGGESARGLKGLKPRSRPRVRPPPKAPPVPPPPITCRVCQRPFERPVRPGRPPSVCGDCREARTVSTQVATEEAA